ncbi:MAG: heparinase II/III family protein, partial [Pseudomonadota bacterium]
PKARQVAQDWVFTWIAAPPAGLAWRADVTGRRMVRWIHHAVLILNRRSADDSRAYFRSLGRQARFLSLRWRAARPGLPRIEALTGMAYAGLALEGQRGLLGPALSALGRECAREVAEDGGLRSRNPEALMHAFTALSWVNQAVSAEGHPLDPQILRALERMAPAIRALRLGDGRMARFHGGDGGLAERIDHALADAGISSAARAEGAMGFARLTAGRTTVVADTARVPDPRVAAERAHASTLGFEMSSGAVPVLVNMGPAAGFGARAARAVRATAAHNTLVLNRLSSARFIADGLIGASFGQRLVTGPRRVTLKRDANEHGLALLASHDGYRVTHGMVHERQLALVHSGAELQGRDRIFAATATDQERVRDALARTERDHLVARIYFRAHPEVEVSLDLGGTVASLRLPGGEIWLLRPEAGEMMLRDATYFEPDRLTPRHGTQVVVTLRVWDYEGAVNWVMTRQAT